MTYFVLIFTSKISCKKWKHSSLNLLFIEWYSFWTKQKKRITIEFLIYRCIKVTINLFAYWFSSKIKFHFPVSPVFIIYLKNMHSHAYTPKHIIKIHRSTFFNYLILKGFKEFKERLLFICCLFVILLCNIFIHFLWKIVIYLFTR